MCRVFFPRFVRILDSAQEESDKSVRGRLSKCISGLERINAPGFILEVIREGYKIPFVSLPPPKHGVNNLSAIKEAVFVCEAILDLLKINGIEELSEVPNIVNPLSVSVLSSGKKRLILDLRHVSLFLYKQNLNVRILGLPFQLSREGFHSLSSTLSLGTIT